MGLEEKFLAYSVENCIDFMKQFDNKILQIRSYMTGLVESFDVYSVVHCNMTITLLTKYVTHCNPFPT